jgi:hypothetical protein
MARWFTNPQAGGSTQLCVDAEASFRTLPDLTIPWGAPPLNTTGLHCELAGYARYKPSEWLARRRMLKRTAWLYAQWSIKYAIPVRWLKAKQLRQLSAIPGWGKGGFTSHAEISKAWGKTNHTDPGPGFETPSGTKQKTVPRDVLMFWTRRYRKRLLKAKPKPKPKLSAEQSTRPANQERPK